MLSSNSVSAGDDVEFHAVSDIAIDNVSYIYVCGTVKATGEERNIRVARFDTSLEADWVYDFNGAADLDDEALSMEVVGTSYVYVTGYSTSTTTGKDIYSVKIGATSGTVAWEEIIDLEGGDDEGNYIAMDSGNNSVIAGTSFKDGDLDIVVVGVKYSNGAHIYTGRYNSEFNKNDYASGAAVDPSNGDIFISGQVEKGDNEYSFMLTKWTPRTIYNPIPSDGFSQSGGYVTNNGQLKDDDDGESNNTVRYYNQTHEIMTYVDNSKISYQLLQAVDTTDTDTTFRVDMSFTKGNTSNKVYPFSDRLEYFNYHLAHMSSSSVRTVAVNELIKPNVYTNTDIIYTHSPSGFRHWIVARSGAPTGDFEMTFTGQTGLSVNGSGNLIVATSCGEIVFTKAKAYTMNNTTGVLTLLGWQPSYSISSNVVSFTSFGSWSGTLVLEYGEPIQAMGGGPPSNMDWSTYVAGNHRDRFFDMKSDAAGNIYVVGFTKSVDFPDGVGQGEINSDLAGDFDAIIVKFSPLYELLWSAFYGSNESEYFSGIAMGQGNRLVLAGTSHSSDWDLPAEEDEFSMPHHQSGETPGSDAFILKVNMSTTFPIWGTYIGTTAADMGVDVLSDKEGNVFICGTTKSTAVNEEWCVFPSEDSFPLCGETEGVLVHGSYGNWDMFISKFDLQNELTWSTMIGSGFNDIPYEMTLVPTETTDDVVIAGTGYCTAFHTPYPAGYTENTNGAGATAMRFSNIGELKWRSSFFNLHSFQSVDYVPQLEGNGRIIFLGGTKHNESHIGCTDATGTTLPLCAGGSEIDIVAEGTEAYILELNAGGMNINWSTFFGGDTFERAAEFLNEDDQEAEEVSPYSFTDFFFLNFQVRKYMDITHDADGVVYLTGLSSMFNDNGTEFPNLVYPDYYDQDMWDGYGFQWDAWIAGFAPNHERFWTTPLGGWYNGSDDYNQEWGCEIITEAMVNASGLFVAGFTPATNYPTECPSEIAYCQGSLTDLEQNAMITHFILDEELVLSTTEASIKFADELMLFPNPTSKTIQLRLNNFTKQADYQIYNTIGQVVTTGTFRGKIDIDAHNMAPGQYQVRIITPTQTLNACFIKE